MFLFFSSSIPCIQKWLFCSFNLNWCLAFHIMWFQEFRQGIFLVKYWIFLSYNCPQFRCAVLGTPVYLEFAVNISPCEKSQQRRFLSSVVAICLLHNLLLAFCASRGGGFLWQGLFHSQYESGSLRCRCVLVMESCSRGGDSQHLLLMQNRSTD